MPDQNFDWNLLKSYLAIATEGSLSAAARVSGISQPTLGRHIAVLENDLGVTLFERQSSGMALTDAGASLLLKAREVETATASFSLAATGRSQTVAGTIRITASDVVSFYLLPQIIAELRRAEPELDIELVSSNEVQNLLTRDADIAIRMVEPSQAELIARKVNDMAIGAFASTIYLDRAGRPEAAEDLYRYSIIGYDRADMMIKGMRSLGYKVERSDFGLRTDAQTVYWRLVEAGAGIGFGSVFIARDNPKLERLLPDLLTPPLPMWITAHRELRTSLRVRRAFDFLYEALHALPLSEPNDSS